MRTLFFGVSTLILLSYTLVRHNLKAAVHPQEGKPSQSSNLPLNPDSQTKTTLKLNAFERLPDPSLSRIRVKNLPLTANYGVGANFEKHHRERYQTILNLPNHVHTQKSTKVTNGTKNQDQIRIQWILANLDKETIVASSQDRTSNFYGASVTKLMVAAAILDQQRGALDGQRYQQLADMIVVSSNSAWGDLQLALGGGSERRGQESIEAFTKRMGYAKALAFRGYKGNVHGNHINAFELQQFLADTYHQRYPGAQTLWQVMHAVRTGKSKGDRYLPKDLMIGGKTGSYRGLTMNQQSGEPYQADVRHHALTFEYNSQQYGVVVLSDFASDEDIAILVGGLYRQHLTQSL